MVSGFVLLSRKAKCSFGVHKRGDGPATPTKLVGLETASVGLAADPAEGRPYGVIESWEPLLSCSWQDSLQTLVMNLVKPCSFSVKYFCFDKPTNSATKNPIFPDIFGPALKSCTNNSQAGFVLMFWIMLVNAASIADA